MINNSEFWIVGPAINVNGGRSKKSNQFLLVQFCKKKEKSKLAHATIYIQSEGFLLSLMS